VCYHTSPVCYHTSPVCYHTSPVCYHTGPVCYHTSPVCYHTGPVCYHTCPLLSSLLSYRSSLLAYRSSQLKAVTETAIQLIQGVHQLNLRWCTKYCKGNELTHNRPCSVWNLLHYSTMRTLSIKMQSAEMIQLNNTTLYHKYHSTVSQKPINWCQLLQLKIRTWKSYIITVNCLEIE